MLNVKYYLPYIIFVLFLSGCGTFHADGSPYQKSRIGVGGTTHFSINEDKLNNLVNCIAVLPFRASPSATDIDPDILRQLRRSVAGKIAPLNFHDIELSSINDASSHIALEDFKSLSKALKCDGLLYGEVSNVNRAYLGVFSHVSMTGSLLLIDARDGKMIWSSEQTSSRTGGGLPISISGAVMGVFSAAINHSDETQASLIDDLGRNLISTLADVAPGDMLVQNANSDRILNSEALGLINTHPKISNALYRHSPQNEKPVAGTIFHHANINSNEQSKIVSLIIREADNLPEMDASLALALAKVESNFSARAKSHKGARGVMQIMPRTASRTLNIHPDHLWDPRVNVKAGLSFLRDLYYQYGKNWDLALSHYNGGTLKKKGNKYVPHRYTRAYVAKVLKWQKYYAKKLRLRPIADVSKRAKLLEQRSKKMVSNTSRAEMNSRKNQNAFSIGSTPKIQDNTVSSNIPTITIGLNKRRESIGILVRNRPW